MPNILQDEKKLGLAFIIFAVCILFGSMWWLAATKAQKESLPLISDPFIRQQIEEILEQKRLQAGGGVSV
jgi:hypothetical protein